ncbi:MAG: tetratricopeptide repeat protein [Ardenticatenaceae bacterium]|nr:tetratricopeptide repeat protein [Ardenticatenaceae bacterium]
MATTVLRDYLELINQLLEDGRYNEATQHCRHILQQYPRHIDTYRALANSLLEQHMYADAADIFHRVLSADPNDFISHVGLAFIHREEGHLPEAVWHMERAYELEPYNIPIQQELHGLYRTRDRKHQTGPLPLNQNALAHLYFRGEMYQMAAAELLALREENGSRIDQDVLLAETLWRDGQRMEAVNVCLQVLEKLPNCIQVNAILGEIWLVAGRIDEAQTYLQTLQALTQVSKADLDPETAVGQAFQTLGAPSLPDQVTVESLSSSNGVASDVADVGTDWVEDETVTDDGEIYSWLQDMEFSESDAALKAAEPPEGKKGTDWFLDEMPTATAAVPEEEWLAELDSGVTAADDDELVSSAMLEAADLFAEEAEPPTGAVEEMPDWLATTTTDELVAIELDDETAADWLRELASVSDEEPESATGGTDWFKDEDEESDKPQTDWFVDEEASEPAADEMDWLEEAESGLEPAYLESGDMEDWFGGDEVKDAETAVPDESPAEEGAVPGWLLTAPLGAADAEETAVPDEVDEGGVPAWLLTAPLGAEMAEASSAKRDSEPESAQLADDEFDWLAEEIAEEIDAVAASEPSLADEALDLTELSQSPDLATGMMSTGQEELPDWLLSSDLGIPAEDEEDDEDEEEDAFISELFGSLNANLVDDDLLMEETELPSEARESEPSYQEIEDTVDEDDFVGIELDQLLDVAADESLQSDELPSWLFATSLGESDELGTGEVDLSQLTEQPQLATGPLDDDGLPDWLDASEEDEVLLEDDQEEEFASASEIEPPEIEELDAFAAVDTAVDVTLEKQGTSLLDWLADDLEETGEMEAADMGDKDEMAQDMPEMPEDDSEGLDEAFDWLEQLDASEEPEDALLAADEQEELPDWMQDLSQTAVSDESETTDPILTGLLESAQAAEASLPVTNMLDWMQESDEEEPDWAEEETPDEDMSAEDSDTADTGMLWLEAMAAEQEAEAEAEMGSTDSAGSADTLAWLDEADQGPEVEMDAAPAEAADDDALAWLEGFESEPSDELIEEDAVMEGVADWLGDLATESDLADEEPVDWDELVEETAVHDALALDELDFVEEEMAESGVLALEELGEAEAEAEDWLAEMLDESVTEGVEELAPLEQPEEQDAEVDDWLAEIITEGEEEMFSLDEQPSIDEEPAVFEETAVPDMAFAAAPIPEELDEGLFDAEEVEDVISWLDSLDIGEETDLDELAAALPDVVSQIDSSSDDLDFAEEEDDVLDWLGDLAEEAEETLAAETAVAADTLEFAELDAEDADLEEGDLDWLGDLAEESEEVAETAVAETESTFAETDEVPEIVFPEDAMFPRDVGVPTDVPEELDDTMAWLAELAAEQGVSLDTTEFVEEPAVVEEEVSAPEPETPEEIPSAEIDDAMAWLEQLAAEQGTPIEPLPTVADRALADTIDRQPELGPIDEAELEVEVAEPELMVEPEPVDEVATALDWLAELALADVSLDDIDTKDTVVSDPAASDLSAALDWVEQQFAAPPEPAVPSDFDVDQIPEDPELALAWLEGMADREDEADTAVAPPSERIMEAEETAVSPDLAAIEDELITAIPDDPDAAMAWLEELAARPDAVPVESVDDVREDIGGDVTAGMDTEIVFPEDAMFPRDVGVPTDVPEELDDTMNWLQDLMAEQGLSMEDLGEAKEVESVVSNEVIEPEAAAPVDEWVEPETAVSESPAIESDEPEIVFPEDAMFPRDVGVPTDVPEELDDTMDWLQDLMAEQGLSMDDLVEAVEAPVAETAVAPEPVETVEEMADDVDLEALFATKADLEPEMEEVTALEAVLPLEEDEPDTGSLDWLSDLSDGDTDDYLASDTEIGASVDFGEDLAQAEQEAFAELESEFNINAELTESWPEWLSTDSEEPPGMGETGWLRSLGEPDVASWLSAEDEITSSGVFDKLSLPDTGPLTSAAFDVGALPEVEPGESADLSEPQLSASFVSVDDDKLNAAREAASSGDVDEAMQAYQELVESGQGLSILIADLETAVQQHPKQPAMRRLLGDAYMRNGQLQKALDTYRQALDMM